MTEPQHRAVIARLSSDVAVISQYLARVSADLSTLDRVLTAPQQYQPQSYSPPPPVATAEPVAAPPRDDGWIGKLLAVAGVTVTLIGVVFLLVLAAQAGILRPEIRVAAGVALAAGLLTAGVWLYARPGGRVGAIALAATGIAAAYIDVIAITTIYEWVSAPVGLVIAAGIGGAGLTLARRWDSQRLGLLVLVPLIALAPVVVGSVTLLLVGFMLALSAASLPVQLGKDWIWLHCARIAASTFPLIVALIAVGFDDGRDLALVGACGVGALLAVAGALILLPGARNRAAMAGLTAVGVLPALCASLAADRVTAALMAGALAAVLLAIVRVGDRLPGVDGIVGKVWTVLAAISAVIAVLVAFDGHIAGPVLLAMAIVVTVVGRGEAVAPWAAVGFAIVGAASYLSYAPLHTLVDATRLPTSAAVSTLVASLLLIAFAAVSVWSQPSRGSAVWAGAAIVAVYALTTFTVTAGVLIGGEGRGFYAGHMAATICWIALAAGLFRYAARLSRADRAVPIGGGLALVAAAMIKLFLFDLGTLDGIFRVVVFIVVGLALLGMGAGYARLLERQDQQQDQYV